FRLNTYYTHVFRSWLLRKAYAKEQKDTYMLFVPIAKGGHC
ncbi:RhuM protein, partial [Mediterranea massiliensis]|nr:RhuM protein [Mediterranea massiliensis]